MKNRISVIERKHYAQEEVIVGVPVSAQGAMRSEELRETPEKEVV